MTEQMCRLSPEEPNLWSYISLKWNCILLDLLREGETAKGESERKREMLEYIVDHVRLPKDRVDLMLKMLNEMRQALKACGYEVRQVRIRALSRGLIGSSETFGSIAFEVGLCFDPFLNVPYIPGSTIKGAVRAGALELLISTMNIPPEDAENRCNKIFGGTSDDEHSIGLVGFTDAYPVKEGEGGRLLYPDVMTPHYKGDTGTELDAIPTPIVHLSIARGVEFQFFVFFKRVRGRRALSVANSADADLSETPQPDINALGIVDKGLLYSFYRGVGAKTGVGYSKFEICEYGSV